MCRAVRARQAEFARKAHTSLWCTHVHPLIDPFRFVMLRSLAGRVCNFTSLDCQRCERIGAYTYSHGHYAMTGQSAAELPFGTSR